MIEKFRLYQIKNNAQHFNKFFCVHLLFINERKYLCMKLDTIENIYQPFIFIIPTIDSFYSKNVSQRMSFFKHFFLKVIKKKLIIYLNLYLTDNFKYFLNIVVDKIMVIW